MGHHGAVLPSCRSILQSYGLCSARASAASLLMMSRYFLNCAGMLGDSVATDATHAMVWVLGSKLTDSSQVNENALCSNLVHLSRQHGLLNHTSSVVQAPWGGCWVTNLKGRKMSISESMGVISNFSHEKCLRCWRSKGLV